MKSLLALVISLALTTATGIATAGMAGQGAAPDAKKPEYKEPNPGPYRTRDDDMKSAKGSPGTETDLLPKTKHVQSTSRSSGDAGRQEAGSYYKSPGRTPGGQLERNVELSFNELDRDDDGYVIERDLRGQPQVVKQLQAQWTKVDKNGDDRIDKAEFNAFDSDHGGK